MKKTLASLATLAVVGAAALTLTAAARHPRDPAAFLTRRVDSMLDTVNATADQRQKIVAIRDQLVADGKKLHAQHADVRKQLLAQWQSPNPDRGQVHALVDGRADAMKAYADEVADALRPPAPLAPRRAAGVPLTISAVSAPTDTVTALLVEDDARLAALTRDYLEGHGVVVTVASDGRRGLAEALARRYDVVLLDLMLPELPGLEVCRELRARSDVPVIVLTARGEEADRVMGLELGADDYLAKPFSPRELLARIRAVVRRARGQAGPALAVVRVGQLVVDPAARTATYRGEALLLTSYEFSLLKALAERAGRVLSREQLMEIAKGTAEESFDRSIDVHVSRLRHKLGDDPKRPRLLKTVRGSGYVLAAPEGEG